MKIDTKFNIGEIVFLITDEDQKARMVVSLKIYDKGILYCLACGTEETYHYEMEIASQKSFNI